jgi:hypothetical protein
MVDFRDHRVVRCWITVWTSQINTSDPSGKRCARKLAKPTVFYETFIRSSGLQKFQAAGFGPLIIGECTKFDVEQ